MTFLRHPEDVLKTSVSAENDVRNLFKVNNEDTRTTPDVVLVSLLLTCFHTLVYSIVDFEEVCVASTVITDTNQLV